MKRIDPMAALELQEPIGVSVEEQARLKKWRAAADRAHATGKMANTLAKALASRFADRWRFIDFRGPKGHESAGIVDILAIRKCGKPPTVKGLKRLDTFDIQLIQVKGGAARLPSAEEVTRLRLVQKHYRADRVVLFQWVKGTSSTFFTLGAKDAWLPMTSSQLFGSGS
jgi:hypothetical protein